MHLILVGQIDCVLLHGKVSRRRDVVYLAAQVKDCLKTRVVFIRLDNNELKFCLSNVGCSPSVSIGNLGKSRQALKTR